MSAISRESMIQFDPSFTNEFLHPLVRDCVSVEMKSGSVRSWSLRETNVRVYAEDTVSPLLYASG